MSATPHVQSHPTISPKSETPQLTEMLHDLITDSIHSLAPVTVAFAWGWSVLTLLFDSHHAPAAYAVLAISAITGLTSYHFSQKHLDLSTLVYIIGVFGTVSVIAATHRDTAALLLYAIVVLIAAMLMTARLLWLVTAMSIICMLVLLWPVTLASLPEAAVPVTIIALAAFAAWISARRLYTALEWALMMTIESQRNAIEAQAHRGEVQRVLKNLDEAYVKLEHTNEALMLAREAADRAYRFKSDFVANVSHELRTPLNLIIGFSEMMVTAPESYNNIALPREYRGDLVAIYRSAKHLADLINDVLDLSQIEAGRMPINKEPAQLETVVNEAVEIVRGLVEARGLRLDVSVPDALPVLQLDRTRIRQVILNLLTNATRFTDKGFIHVCARIEPGQVVILVEDSGRGIAPDKLKLAFEAFTQLHEDQIRDGTGLGLAVSRRFISLHGGRMWIESTEGRGTTVFFSLPITDVKIAQEKDGLPLSAPTDLPLVIVVHTDPRALSLLRRYIPQCAFAMANTPERIAEWLQHASPAAILIDKGAENEVMKWLAEISANIPPVVISELPGMRRTGTLLGAVDYLAKPVTREALMESLTRLGLTLQRVLIVDDDPHIVRLLSRMIKAEDPDIQIFEAFSGEEGLAIARTQAPDCMLLDLLMPEISGYDVLNQAHDDAILKHLPIIIISARGIEDEGVPLDGEVRVNKHDGFSTTEVLKVMGAIFAGLA